MGALVMYAFVIIVAVVAGVYYIRQDKKINTQQRWHLKIRTLAPATRCKRRARKDRKNAAAPSSWRGLPYFYPASPSSKRSCFKDVVMIITCLLLCVLWQNPVEVPWNLAGSLVLAFKRTEKGRYVLLTVKKSLKRTRRTVFVLLVYTPRRHSGWEDRSAEACPPPARVEATEKV